MDEVAKLDGMVPAALAPRTLKLKLDSLEVVADCGFHEHEVGNPQRLRITVELWLDEAAPPPDDDPERAWNYDFLREEVVKLARSGRYNLQETLVFAIYQRVAACNGVKALRVSSAKPDIYADAAGVGVELSSFDEAGPRFV